MSFLLASIVCIVGIAGLFYLDRDKSLRTSKALWLPVIWLWIVGSRPVSAWLTIWLGARPQPLGGEGLDAQLDGSPTDALVFFVILAVGTVVLFRRKTRTTALLKASLPVLLYFVYCLVSVSWSPYPGVAFKRWIKAIGDLVMVLVVVTEADPIAAFRRLFSRVGFILLPTSVLFIRYSELGRGYDPDGNYMNTGVTTNKNTLGVITFVVSLGTLWTVRMLLRSRRQPHRGRRLLAQCILLAFGVALLAMANSATSVACFGLGTLLILATGLSSIRHRPNAVHSLVLTILLVGGLTMFLGGEGRVLHALGRQTNLTGRTDIWKAVIPLVPNRLIGAGFESFWIGPSMEKLWLSLSNWMGIEHLNEAHNGYIEVYLNLGWVGVCLMAWILISGYRQAVSAFRRNSDLGSLLLAYVATAAIYNVTEAGFRMLAPIWIFLLLAVVAAGGTAAGLVRSGASRLAGARKNRFASRGLALTPQEETIATAGSSLQLGTRKVWNS
jgi:O-antigen ligase